MATYASRAFGHAIHLHGSLYRTFWNATHAL